MIACGRIRKPIGDGWTPLVEDRLQYLQTAALRLAANESYAFDTGEREYGLVLVHGHCDVAIEGEAAGTLGPRNDPFADPPSGVLAARGARVTVTAREPTLLGVGSAPAAERKPSAIVGPAATRSASRGADNWTREVRFVLWSDNTEGNMLIVGETVTPSGNWSTVPPHRHQIYAEGEEAEYEEVYFIQMSRPRGFGISYQFDDAGALDQPLSLKHNDSVYMGGGYHPTACGPGADLYHLTFMAGPQRISRSRVHPDFVHLLEDKGMANPFDRQTAKP